MKQNKPLVSILLPIFNGGKFLSISLQSLLGQSYKQIEIVAIDDKSKDNCWKILTKFKKRDRRLRIYKNKKHYGLSICLNRAVRKSKGAFIALMDCQSIATRDRIKRQLNFLLKNPKVVALGTQSFYMDEKGKNIGKTTLPREHGDIVKSLLSGESIQLETVMINRQLLPKDILHFGHHPYPYILSEVIIKLLSYGEITNLPWALYYHRVVSSPKPSIQQLPSFLKHLVKSVALYDYRPSLRSIFSPAAKQI